MYILHTHDYNYFTIMKRVAYLSVKTARVFANYEDAYKDAKMHIENLLDVETFEEAKQLATLQIKSRPKKYIQIVFLYL